MEENNATPYHKVVIPLCRVRLEVATSSVTGRSNSGRNKRNSHHVFLHIVPHVPLSSVHVFEQQNTNVMIWSCVIFFHRG